MRDSSCDSSWEISSELRLGNVKPGFWYGSPNVTATPPRTTPVFPPVLCQNAVEILRPFRPAFHTPRMLVTVLVAQHRGLAGRVGARGMPGVVAPRQQVAFQGGLEGRGGVLFLQLKAMFLVM